MWVISHISGRSTDETGRLPGVAKDEFLGAYLWR